jgi:hypothetical protein
MNHLHELKAYWRGLVCPPVDLSIGSRLKLHTVIKCYLNQHDITSMFIAVRTEPCLFSERMFITLKLVDD